MAKVLFLLFEKSDDRDYHQKRGENLHNWIEKFKEKGNSIIGYTMENDIWEDDNHRFNLLMRDINTGETRGYLETAENPKECAVCEYRLVDDGYQWMLDKIENGKDADAVIFSKIGPWELQGRGFYTPLEKIIKEGKQRAIIVCRTQDIKKIIEKLNIGEYEIEELMPLSQPLNI